MRGRPLEQDALYARDLGLEGRYAKRKVKRAGGVEKLQGCDESTRNLLVKSTGPLPQSGGLRARGIPTHMSFSRRAEIEQRIEQILRKRGLK